jgi:hypothetical protein
MATIKLNYSSPLKVLNLRSRAKAMAIHFSLSLLFGIAVFLLVRFVWFPEYYWEMAGGKELFFLVITVDVILGPCLTFAVFNPNKKKKLLVMDLTVITMLQFCALAYGVYSISISRPLYTVFAVDRLNVVTASELNEKEALEAELPEYRGISWFGPKLVATRPAKDMDEKMKRIDSAMSGKDVHLFPKYFVPYQQQCEAVKTRLQSLTTLKEKNTQHGSEIDEIFKGLGSDANAYGYLPLVTKNEWVALISKENCSLYSFYRLNGF